MKNNKKNNFIFLQECKLRMEQIQKTKFFSQLIKASSSNFVLEGLKNFTFEVLPKNSIQKIFPIELPFLIAIMSGKICILRKSDFKVQLDYPVINIINDLKNKSLISGKYYECIQTLKQGDVINQKEQKKNSENLWITIEQTEVGIIQGNQCRNFLKPLEILYNCNISQLLKPYFKILKENILQIIVNKFQIEKLRKGQEIIQYGKMIDQLFITINGHFMLEKMYVENSKILLNKQNHSNIINNIKNFQIKKKSKMISISGFCLLGYTTKNSFQYSCKSIKDQKIFVLEKKYLLNFMDSVPNFKKIVDEMSDFYETIIEDRFKSKQKLYSKFYPLTKIIEIKNKNFITKSNRVNNQPYIKMDFKSFEKSFRQMKSQTPVNNNILNFFQQSSQIKN